MKRILHEMEQGSDDWFNVRAGKATSSNFACIMANDESFGEPAKRYAMRIALEKKTGRMIETYSNERMKLGVELEPVARRLYEESKLVNVEEVGFMEYGRWGSSSDGLVGGDGIIEVKSVDYPSHFKRMKNGGYDTAYRWQIVGELAIFERDWCDFVSYCPLFPDDKQLYIFRVNKSADDEERLFKKLERFNDLVDEYFNLL